MVNERLSQIMQIQLHNTNESFGHGWECVIWESLRGQLSEENMMNTQWRKQTKIDSVKWWNFASKERWLTCYLQLSQSQLYHELRFACESSIYVTFHNHIREHHENNPGSISNLVSQIEPVCVNIEPIDAHVLKSFLGLIYMIYMIDSPSFCNQSGWEYMMT